MNIEQLVDLVVCPKCRAKLSAVAVSGAAEQGLACGKCELLFALEDGLPNMLISEARAWPLSAASTAT
ncbi:MAG: Trm112 family protein [Polyangiales bacterium]